MDPTCGKPAGFTVRLPWYESIPVGSLVGGLLAGYQYYVYSSPIQDNLEIWGFNANFEAIDSVRIQLTDVDEKDVWNPFFSTPGPVVLGFQTQAEPILKIPVPYFLPAGHKVQIFIQNTSVVNIGNPVFTLAGIRLRQGEVSPCFN